jgi:hypothetical protein
VYKYLLELVDLFFFTTTTYNTLDSICYLLLRVITNQIKPLKLPQTNY